VFLEGFKADPKGKKAADSLLKLGMSLSGLDKRREACTAFNKVTRDFPNISKGMRRTISKEKKKNSCP
jgi:TolA-binding protein